MNKMNTKFSNEARIPTEKFISKKKVKINCCWKNQTRNLTFLFTIVSPFQKRYDLLKDTKPSNDAEMTLQFLKSAVYYFLTDPVNAQGHLTAILSILGYNDAQKDNIMKTQAHAWKYSYY